MRVGVVGATGQVGSLIRSILIERSFPVDSIRFFASARSAGTVLDFAGERVRVEEAARASWDSLDLVLMSCGAPASRELAPVIAAGGAIVVDNSPAWRMDPSVPLVVPEVNGEALEELRRRRPEHGYGPGAGPGPGGDRLGGDRPGGDRPGGDSPGGAGIVANPNCTTMVAMPALWPLHVRAGLRSLTVSTYQAVSGAGGAGVDELARQLAKVGEGSQLAFDGQAVDLPRSTVFPGPVACNVLPVAGRLLDDGSGETSEERKVRDESRKILGIPDLPVSVTCVRVPVFTGHALAIHAELDQPLTAQEAASILAAAPGLRLSEMPTPLDATGHDPVLVGRIRQDLDRRNGLALFVVGDNLRKGAALNAVQIAENLVERELLPTRYGARLEALASRDSESPGS